MNKLALGTVQFGMSYGISNAQGVPALAEIKAILELAHSAGLLCLDTAAAYGDSESSLGKSLAPNHGFRIITKTGKDLRNLEADFSRSLEKLGQKSVYGLMVHDAADLLGSQGEPVFSALRALQKSGHVQKIGVSVYTGEQIDRVLERHPIELIQLPFNLLDQRLLHGGHLAKLKSAGVEVHARSVFLQGLLLLNPKTLPAHFNSIREHLTKIHDRLATSHQTMLQTALKFVLQQNDIDHMVVGVCSRAQLEEILAATRTLTASDESASNFSDCAWTDEKILNPALWPSR